MSCLAPLNKQVSIQCGRQSLKPENGKSYFIVYDKTCHLHFVTFIVKMMRGFSTLRLQI